jgi:PTS system mannose-specific IIB component
LSDSARDRGDIWVRVDDRLIHGQVTVGWRQYLRYAEIWVVDDQVQGDLYVQDALCLAAPDGVEVRVYGIEEAVAALSFLGQKMTAKAVTLNARTVDVVPTNLRAVDAVPTAVGPSNQRVTQAPRACSVLLLVRSPETALALVEGGVLLDRLNVGNLSARPGSVRVFKSISLTPAHVEALDALAGRGVCITFQLAPEDARADWPAVRRRMSM